MPTIKKLELYIGGYFGSCYNVTYDNGELVYSVSSRDKASSIEERIRPTSKDWEAFFKTCDEIDSRLQERLIFGKTFPAL